MRARRATDPIPRRARRRHDRKTCSRRTQVLSPTVHTIPSSATQAHHQERPVRSVATVSVIGIGHLGVTHAACMAELRFDVIGLDIDARRIAERAAGRLPFVEPGLAPVRTSPSSRAHWPSTSASQAGSCDPASGSAAVACPRTSGPSPPAPRRSARGPRRTSCARSMRSTCAAATGRPTWSSPSSTARPAADASPCSGRRSDPVPTTCATHPRWTWSTGDGRGNGCPPGCRRPGPADAGRRARRGCSRRRRGDGGALPVGGGGRPGGAGPRLPLHGRHRPECLRLRPTDRPAGPVDVPVPPALPGLARC